MSAIPRIFVRSDLAEAASVPLTDDQASYLLRVLRLQVGDPVRVFNGRDGDWRARVAVVEGRRANLTAEIRMRPQTPPGDLWLLFAPLKKTRTDFVVEKAAELGASLIWPVMTDRTQASRVNTARLQATAIEASEQTERLDVPDVREPAALTAALQDWPAGRALIYADEAGDDGEAPWGGDAGRAPPLLEALQSATPGPAAILVGPEGGFSTREREDLRKRAFVTPASLGPRILRAETAVVSALTLWQAALGDWRTRP